MPNKLSILRSKLLYRASLHEVIIHAVYFVVVIFLVLCIEMSMHHLNEEFFLAWVCADVRGAMMIVIPANDEKLVAIERIKHERKKRAVVILKEFLTIAFVAIISYNITEWALDREVHGAWWWTLDIGIIMLLWVGHYYLIEFMVKRYEHRAHEIAAKMESQ